MYAPLIYLLIEICSSILKNAKSLYKYYDADGFCKFLEVIGMRVQFLLWHLTERPLHYVSEWLDE